jgi:hypothetical protein
MERKRTPQIDKRTADPGVAERSEKPYRSEARTGGILLRSGRRPGGAYGWRRPPKPAGISPFFR